MKRILPSSAFLFLIPALLCGPATLTASNKPETFLKQQNSRSGFIENKGQILDQNNKPNPAVLYLLNTPGMNVQLRKGGFSYDLYQECGNAGISSQCGNAGKLNAGINSNYPASSIQNPASSIQYPASSISFHRVDLDLQDCNPDYTIETSGKSSDYLNYYTTGTPAEGVTSVRSYSSITYKNIYPGIDLQFINDDRQFEYNFILQPGADINSIKLKVYGPEKIKKFREGLRCETSLGDVDEAIPLCYYKLNNIQVPVKGRFKKIAEHLYGFAIDQIIPSDAVLLIDPIPTRRWGTYYGGESGEGMFYKSLAVDMQGNVVLGGMTNSFTNIATTGAFQTTFGGGTDAFFVKFDGNGQRLWGTYFGGNHADDIYAIALDQTGNIFIVGMTSSTTGIASPGAFQTIRHGGIDSFIAKFDPSGSRLWATYYGGNEIVPPDGDWINACGTDKEGNIYCFGETSSPDFIATPGAHQTTLSGSRDAFMVKFTGDGNRVWGTYYGGSYLEQEVGGCVTKNGILYISGTTASTNNIATSGSFLPNLGTSPKAFLACFDTSGVRSWGTYFGGENTEHSRGCVADTGSDVYLFGYSNSATNIGTAGTFQTFKIGVGNINAYLEKFTSSGQRTWGTYLGAGDAKIYDASVDDSGFVYLSGYASAQDTLLFSPDGYQTVFHGTLNAILAKFSGNGQRIWSTYYGGMEVDWGYACTTDSQDNIYLAGQTWSVNHSGDDGLCSRSPRQNYISTPGAYQRELNLTDVFLVKFSDCFSPDTALQIIGPSTLCQNSTGVIFSIAPIPTASDYTWCVTGDMTITSGQHTTSITVDVGSALGIDTISVYGINSCDNGFPKLLLVNVVPRPVPVITGNTSPLSGTSYIYSTETGKTNYQWTFSSGGSLVSGGGVNDPTITIQWNVTGAQWVRVSYTDANGCSATTPTQMDITVTTTVTVDFTSPDTVCVGAPINITNLTQGGTTFYWNFCSGSANNDPLGVNIGNPGGLLNVPGGITLAQEVNNCYSFISCQFVSGIVRYYHGTTFGHSPVSWTALGTFGILTDSVQGIQVKNDNGNWYGFVCNNNKLAKLSFGSSLANTPTAVTLGPFSGLTMLSGLVILKEGATWLGFATCSWGNKFVRFNFGNSLDNTPVLTDFGNLGVTTLPGALDLIQENGLSYALIVDNGSNLIRLTFGNSLLNVPTAENLGNPGGFSTAGGLTLLRDCSSTTGYWTNYLVNGQLGKLTFPTGITGSVSGTVLGNIGSLNRPHTFSEIFRQNDTLFSYITNRGSYTMTRLAFPPCTNASVPSSTLFNPPSFSYNQPGTFNIHLIVDEGLLTMTSLCKPVVVMIPPVLNLGPDKSVCPGNTTLLDAGPGFTSYLWSTGATTRTITVPAGTYWVNGMHWGCTASDTILVSALVGPSVNLGPDTTICSGHTMTFDAGVCAGCAFQWSNLTLGLMNIGNGQTYTTGTAANYMVTVVGPNSCMGRDTVQLFVNPVNPVTLTISASDNNVCSGTLITFLAIAGNPGTAPVYRWFVNGNPVGINSNSYSYAPANGDVVTCTVTSNIACPVNNPASSLPITMTVNPYLPVTVSITASSNPFCLGGPVTFTATPGGGGLTPSYQWKVNGANIGTDSQTFIYNPADGDQVYCILTSSETCTSNNPASSISITMIQNNSLPAGVSIAASSNPFCPGTSVTFTAFPIHGGPTPSYQWKVNGINAGANSSTYTYNPVTNDSVRCIMTSNLPCVTGSPVSSAKITMTGNLAPIVIFTSCFDTITTINAKPIKLKGGIPLGGIYSGPGVNSLTGIFTPSVAGVGTHTITYSYTNAALCSASKSISILNLPSSILTCGNPLIDVRDNKVYQTVQIGMQCWLATNLNFGTILASAQDQRDNCIAEKYCYNDNPVNCTNHGGLYQWDEVMLFDETPAIQGFCPPGWHIPTENEWNILFASYINNGFAGSPLKYSGYSGFNALLSGTRHINRGWDFQGFATFFWSSTPDGARNAWAHGMNDPDPSVSSYLSSRVNAFSVRCLKD